ncbi:anti-phage protein KwaB [Thiolapillus sp.]|uniref:anti-phage protein KwaB n=4 Tax=Thiolapillus sp. TaxID=2017437 RepID=UPI0025CE1EC6|nr:anti-phage protein KwaB [Thiolapillus sp.]
MNSEELKASLQPYYDNYDEIGVTVYAILKDAETPGPRKIDIEAGASDGLKTLFIQSLRDTISDREDLSVLNLSASDERGDAIYQYDIDLPEELAAMESILETDDLPLLDVNASNLKGIKALLIEIGNNIGQIVLYKTMAPVNIFGRTSFFLKKSKHRLERINYEFLRVSTGFQLMRVAGELFVIDLEALERSFGFHDVIKKEAALGISAIDEIQLVDNVAVLHELLDDVKYARRFTKIAKSSPVLLAAVPNNSIIKFCKTFPKLVNKIRFNEAEDKIVLDTKVSKDLFIKLLMDDFLTSELTQFHYSSVAKDSVEETEEN